MDNNSIQLVDALIETGNVDTVYRDVYLERARALFAPVLSLEEFRGIEQGRAALAELPHAIERALDKADWSLVKELTGRAEGLRQQLESKKKLVETARGVYAVTDVRVDPFSPGLQQFAHLPTRDLATLATRTIEHLTTLEQGDPPWKDFYAGRRAAFQKRARIGAGQGDSAATATVDARAVAAQALRAGDMRGLEKLADTMMAAARSSSEAAHGTATVEGGPTAEHARVDLRVSYSDDTLKRARQLGLALRHLESRVELTSLRQYAWNPVSGHGDVNDVVLPAGSDAGLRDRVEMLMINPIVNSGGARHLPRFEAEDVLVEDFADPTDDRQPPATELLSALGLPGRRGLARLAIEQALLTHGASVVETGLGLDPRVFRLVCIPSDVHLRLSEAEGWGRQPFWIHFDGYVIKANGRLEALAGGDVRYGGRYDLLGVARDYDSNRLVARFAVVQRERMAAW